MKCSVGFCARDAQRAFKGRKGITGAAPRIPGIMYCTAHYQQIRKGHEPKPVMQRSRPDDRAQVVEDCACIAEFHGYNDLATLLRRLKK